MRRPLVWAACVVLAGMASAAHASNFTSGDIVVLEGDDQSADTGTVPAYLDEFTPTGSLVQQIPLPTASSGSTNALTLSNASDTSHEGVLTLSENGQFLTVAGYDTAPGTTAALSASTGTVATVGVDHTSLNTSTTFQSGNQNIRAATTIDGNEFYIAEAHQTNGTTSAGLNYISGSGSTATQTVLNATLDARTVAILGGANPSTGVLALGSGSSSFESYGGSGHGVYALTSGASAGLPTSSSFSGTQINNDASDGSDIVFDNEPGNLNGTYHGYNTLYIAGNTSGVAGFIEKYSWNGTEFVADAAPSNGNSTEKADNIVETAGVVDPVGITEELDPATGNIDVFYTEPGGIYELNTPDNSEDGFVTDVSSTIASPGANAYFYGIAGAPVPEPASLGILALGGFGLLARRRRRMA